MDGFVFGVLSRQGLVGQGIGGEAHHEAPEGAEVHVAGFLEPIPEFVFRILQNRPPIDGSKSQSFVGIDAPVGFGETILDFGDHGIGEIGFGVADAVNERDGDFVHDGTGFEGRGREGGDERLGVVEETVKGC